MKRREKREEYHLKIFLIFFTFLWGDFWARSIHANWKLIKLFFVQQPSNFTICNSISSLSALLIPDHLIGQEWPATKTRHFTVAQKREVSNWKTLKKNSRNSIARIRWDFVDSRAQLCIAESRCCVSYLIFFFAKESVEVVIKYNLRLKSK